MTCARLTRSPTSIRRRCYRQRAGCGSSFAGGTRARHLRQLRGSGVLKRTPHGSGVLCTWSHNRCTQSGLSLRCMLCDTKDPSAFWSSYCCSSRVERDRIPSDLLKQNHLCSHRVESGRVHARRSCGREFGQVTRAHAWLLSYSLISKKNIWDDHAAPGSCSEA